MDEPWSEKVSCTGSITLALIFLELFPFVNFLKMAGQVTHVFRVTPNSSSLIVIILCRVSPYVDLLQMGFLSKI